MRKIQHLMDALSHACLVILASLLHSKIELHLHEEAPHQLLFSDALILSKRDKLVVNSGQDLVEDHMSYAFHHLALFLFETVKVGEHFFFLRANDVPFSNLEHS